MDPEPPNSCRGSSRGISAPPEGAGSGLGRECLTWRLWALSQPSQLLLWALCGSQPCPAGIPRWQFWCGLTNLLDFPLAFRPQLHHRWIKQLFFGIYSITKPRGIFLFPKFSSYETPRTKKKTSHQQRKDPMGIRNSTNHKKKKPKPKQLCRRFQQNIK